MSNDNDNVDVRLEWISEYVLRTLKVKYEKWQKMYALDENKNMIQLVLDKSDNAILVFYTNAAGALCVSLEFPNSLKQKAVYFIKKHRDPIPKENFKAALNYGDLSNSPLEQLSALVDEVTWLRLL